MPGGGNDLHGLAIRPRLSRPPQQLIVGRRYCAQIQQQPAVLDPAYDGGQPVPPDRLARPQRCGKIGWQAHGRAGEVDTRARRHRPRPATLGAGRESIPARGKDARQPFSTIGEQASRGRQCLRHR